MALHRAVGCDTSACLALYIAAPRLGPAAAQYAAARAGWEISAGGLVNICPSCRKGGNPLLERGNCPTCSGSTHDDDIQRVEVCRHCGHTTPFPVVDEDQEDDADHHRGGDVLAVVRTEGSRP